MNTARWVVLLATGWLFGCGTEGELAPAEAPAGEESTAGPAPTSSFGAPAPAEQATPSRGESCKRVDLAFAVDNSGSMSEEKLAMRSIVFPAFADRLESIGGGLGEHRAGVVDACASSPILHTRGAAGDCKFASGKAWMDASSPTLLDEFACVGNIWSGDTTCTGKNDDEQPASTIAAALELARTAGSPNDGFLRDDALLVAVAITDEDEQPTATDRSARAVYERLVATKGDVKRMVFLGIGGASVCDGAYGHAREAAKLKEVTDLFAADGRGVFWDLCQGKLEDGLSEAMRVIEKACDEFVPAGLK